MENKIKVLHPNTSMLRRSLSIIAFILFNYCGYSQSIASSSLTIASSTTLNGTALNYYATSSLTAFTFSFSNILDGETVVIDYSKTTATDCVITFPANTVLSTHSDVTSITSTTVTLHSTANGRYTIHVRNINGTYRVLIEQDIQ